jgi:hypothetical protein
MESSIFCRSIFLNKDLLNLPKKEKSAFKFWNCYFIKGPVMEIKAAVWKPDGCQIHLNTEWKGYRAGKWIG